MCEFVEIQFHFIKDYNTIVGNLVSSLESYNGTQIERNKQA